MFCRGHFFKLIIGGFILISSLSGNVNQKKLLLNRSEVSTNLKKLLCCIHDFYESENEFEMINQIKKSIRGFCAANMNWLDFDTEREPSLDFLFESSNSEEREVGLYIVGGAIISNENPAPDDCLTCNIDDKYKITFFDTCLKLANDWNINVKRAAYDFLSMYIPKHKELYVANEKRLSKIIDNGLLLETDAFIRNCSLKLKCKDLSSAEYLQNKHEDTEFHKSSFFLIQLHLKEMTDKAIRFVNSGKIHLQHKGLCILKQLVKNDSIDYKDALQAISKCLPNICNKVIFKDWTNLIISLIDKDVEINPIIGIVSEIDLATCNFDSDGNLLDIYTKLTNFPAFLGHGLKIICQYNSLGGLLSYGEAFSWFIDAFVENYVEANLSIEELRKFAEKCIADYECLGSLSLGLEIYTNLIGNDVCFTECSNLVKCMVKKGTKLDGFLWSLYSALVKKKIAVNDAIKYAQHLMYECKDQRIDQAASLLATLVSNGYARDYANEFLRKMEKINSGNLSSAVRYLKNVINENQC